MTREEAINIYQGLINPRIKEAFEFFVPELRESEDERIRKALIDGVRQIRCKNGITQEQMISYLEKQKENLKSADSIPSDCTSGAKCEDRWHKVGDSLPDDPREVLCKDEAGNYFIGRYYVGEGWEISNYDDEDKPHHLNPPVSKWIDFPSEKQKEQKPVEWTELTWKDIVELEGIINNVHYDFRAGIGQESFGKEVLERFRNTKNDAEVDACGPKPAEWSEEDEKVYQYLKAGFEYSGNRLSDQEHIMPGLTIGMYRSFIDKLKSLRPHWKPSEEQMEAFKGYIKDFQEKAEAAVGGWNNFDVMIRLYEQLKKLI